jgi:hypothetical protein
MEPLLNAQMEPLLNAQRAKEMLSTSRGFARISKGGALD